jgi:hypothetical protein
VHHLGVFVFSALLMLDEILLPRHTLNCIRHVYVNEKHYATAVVVSAMYHLGPPRSIAVFTFAAIREATELPLGGQVLQSLAVSFVGFRLLHK